VLALIETIGNSTGINIEVIVALAGVTATIVIFVLQQNARSKQDAATRHEILRNWAESTFLRKDLYSSEAASLGKKVDRIEAMVELIWRAQRKEIDDEPR
jgi:hypothetical protein